MKQRSKVAHVACGGLCCCRKKCSVTVISEEPALLMGPVNDLKVNQEIALLNNHQKRACTRLDQSEMADSSIPQTLMGKRRCQNAAVPAFDDVGFRDRSHHALRTEGRRVG